MLDGDAIAVEIPRHIAQADADFHAPAAKIIRHRQILGQAHRLVQGQDGYVGGKAYMLGARGHRRGHGNPGWQIAVVDEMMLGKPDQVDTKAVQPDHLFHDFAIKGLVVDAAVGGIAKIVDHPDAQIWFHGAAPQ